MSDTEYQPLKGDPDVLKAKADHYANIADAIKRSTTTLRRIHDMDGMKSKAVDALKGSADDVADDIDKAHDRYSKTASALITYSQHLRSAQDDATTAIAHIDAKQHAANAAHTAATTAQDHADSASDADKSSTSTAATKAHHAATEADGALDAAHKEWHEALDKKNTAADAAVKVIVDVVDHHNNGLKNPGFWEKLAKGAFEILKVVCKWAGVLSIFLSWVPILGQILLVLTAIGAVISMVEAIVKFAKGDIGFWSMMGTLALGVVTLFGGKILSVLGKNLRGTMALKAFSKAGGELKAGKALQGPMALGKRAATRTVSEGSFRSLMKDPLNFASAGKGFQITGVKQFATESAKQSIKKFTAKGMVGDEMWAMGGMAQTSRELFTTGQAAGTIALTGLNFAKNVKSLSKVTTIAGED